MSVRETPKIAPAEGKLGVLLPGLGAVATTLIALSFPTVKLRWLLLVMMIPAIGAEVIQVMFAPGRTGSWKDAVASYAGSVLALAAIISGKYRTWLISCAAKPSQEPIAGIASASLRP